MSDVKQFSIDVQRVIQDRFGEEKASHLLDVLKDIVPADAGDFFGVLNARKTKRELAGVLNKASEGKPQLIQRANDELPLILMSMESVMAVLDHEVQAPVSFWDSIGSELLPIEQSLKLKARPRERSKYLGRNVGVDG